MKRALLVALLLLSMMSVAADDVSRTLAWESACLDLDAGAMFDPCPRFAPGQGWDVRAGYHAGRDVHAVLVPNIAGDVEIAWLEGVAYADVSRADVETASFHAAPVDRPFAGVALVRTDAGAVFKVGEPSEGDGGLTFSFARVEADPAPTFGTDAANRPPAADAGADDEAECGSPAGATIRLDGSGSTDPDSSPGTNDDIVSFEWFEGFGSGSPTLLGAGMVLDVALPSGVHVVTLRVTDNAGATGNDDVVKTVTDTVAPAGRIVGPSQGGCYDLEAAPVPVLDEFVDACDAELSRTYEPPPGPGFKLRARDGQPEDGLGATVAVSGNDVALGAKFNRARGVWSGSVYVFRRKGLYWEEAQKLNGSDETSGDFFGSTVAMDGDTLVVGAERGSGYVGNSGVLYAFERTPAGWVERQKLAGGGLRPWDLFGKSLSIHGDWVVAGAPDHDLVGFGSGMAHVFRRTASGWVSELALTALTPGSFQQFGDAVAVHGDFIVVGARNDDERGFSAGAAWVFRWDGTRWDHFQKLTASDAAIKDWFGSSVAIHGDTIAVGAFGADDNGGQSGAVYVYRFDGATWTEEAKLIASDGATNDRFSWSLALEGDLLAVAAYLRDVPQRDAGAVYVFERTAGGWVESTRLVASDGARADGLGNDVALDAGTVVAGAPGDDDRGRGSGAAYVFEGDVLRVDAERFGLAAYEKHGDYSVLLTVEDDSGNLASDSVDFAIDLVPPAVFFRRLPERLAIPATMPFTNVFLSNDDDMASGDIVVERMYWDDCLLFDGASHGDGDGSLQDETFAVDEPFLCAALTRCGLPAFREPVLRVEAFDCAANRREIDRELPIVPEIEAVGCAGN